MQEQELELQAEQPEEDHRGRLIEVGLRFQKKSRPIMTCLSVFSCSLKEITLFSSTVFDRQPGETSVRP